MRTAKVILSDTQVMCPCCGYALRVGATVRLKANREIGQMPILDDDQVDAVRAAVIREEAEGHG